MAPLSGSIVDVCLSQQDYSPESWRLPLGPSDLFSNPALDKTSKQHVINDVVDIIHGNQQMTLYQESLLYSTFCSLDYFKFACRAVLFYYRRHTDYNHVCLPVIEMQAFNLRGHVAVMNLLFSHRNNTWEKVYFCCLGAEVIQWGLRAGDTIRVPVVWGNSALLLYVWDDSF